MNYNLLIFKKLLIMKLFTIAGIFIALAVSVVCTAQKVESTTVKEADNEAFDYLVEQFADIKVLRYQIPGWESLTLKEQKIVY
jgi:dipeptidyl-peptidase-3